MKNFKHNFFKIFFGLLLAVYFVFVAVFGFLYAGPKPEPTPIQDATWGINFSQKQARALELDWQETYLALLDDLGARHFRIPVYWDEVEETRDEFNFEEWDWQLDQLHERGGTAIVAVGIKLPRWPECHLPDWVDGVSQEEKEEELLGYIEAVVTHYKDHPAIEYWQVENEFFLYPFGECPPPNADLLDREIALVREIDPSRQIMITDSGELSTWIPSGRRADIFGSTLYRIIYNEHLGFVEYWFFTPTFHARKEAFLHLFRPDLEVIVIEMQAEPWVTVLPLSDASFEEQAKSMSVQQFEKNVDFALNIGWDTFYLWGAEWWYWMKETQDKPEIWEYAKYLFEISQK